MCQQQQLEKQNQETSQEIHKEGTGFSSDFEIYIVVLQIKNMSSHWFGQKCQFLELFHWVTSEKQGFL